MQFLSKLIGKCTKLKFIFVLHSSGFIFVELVEHSLQQRRFRGNVFVTAASITIKMRELLLNYSLQDLEI